MRKADCSSVSCYKIFGKSFSNKYPMVWPAIVKVLNKGMLKLMKQVIF
jgi:hypothetical protein